MLSERAAPPPPDESEGTGVIPTVVPPLPRENARARNLPWRTAFEWLQGGIADAARNPTASLAYGVAVFAVSALVVWLLLRFDLGYALFPALAGFMVIGPPVALGLYEKSRRLERGERCGLTDMVFVTPRSGYQALFLGVMLLGLFMLWIRAAVLLYALFFGMAPFPAAGDMLATVFMTPTGWALLVCGGAVGTLFAAFAFAISVFAVPMLLTERTDALSAMGISMAMVWSNLPVMLAWGAIVLALFLVSVATALLGLVLVFPILGHGTWRAYRAIRPEDRQDGESERLFIQPA